MIKSLNRFGDIDFTKNEALFTIPLLRLDTEEIEILEENYRRKIKEIDYVDTFIYANHLSAIRDRLQLSFDLTNSIDFNHLHKLTFKELLPYLNTAAEIAKVNVNVLWEKNNFVVDIEEKRIKAILFEFDGFKIYKNDDALDGLKEIILLSLTKIDRILGKPKRSDFIEQTDRVIQFAEDVLRANGIDEIERIILSYKNEIEYEELKKQQEEEERKNNSKLTLFLSKFKREKKEINLKEKVKEDLQKNFEGKSKNKEIEKRSLIDKMTSPKGMIITGVILAVGLAVYIIGDFENAGKANASEEEILSEKVTQQDKILESYRLYMSGTDENIETAYTTLDNVGYDNLNKEDKEVLIDWYLEQDQFTKAIATDRNASYKIGDKLIAEDDGLEKLEEIAGSIEENEVLTFDIAAMKKQYQVVIENNNIKYNNRRAKDIVEAYVMTNQIEDMERLMEELKENDEKSYEYVYEYAERLTDKYVEKRELNEELQEVNKELEQTEKALDKTKKKNKKKELNKQIKQHEKKVNELQDKITDINNSIKKG